MSQHTPPLPASDTQPGRAPPQRRSYTGPSAREIAWQIHGPDGRARGGRYRLRGVCHGGDSAPPKGGSLSIWDQDQGLGVRCFKGCDRRTVIEALESATGLTIWNAWDGAQVHVRTRRPAPAPPPRDPTTSRSHHHLQLWTFAEHVPPASPEHPARRWLAARNLYWPQLPLPAAVRWLPANVRWPEHLGAGAVVALFAPPSDWLNAWPKLPRPTAVEMIHVDRSGSPALDRPDGLSKRTHGSRTGAVCMMGDPRPEASTTGTLLLTEGLADAMAMAARLPHTAAAVGGTSGLHPETFGHWLSSWDSVEVHADADAEGLAAARRLWRRAQDIKLLRMPHVKDVADFAASDPLPHVDLDAARELAADLEAEGLPRWEAARQAVLSVGEPPEPDTHRSDQDAEIDPQADASSANTLEHVCTKTPVRAEMPSDEVLGTPKMSELPPVNPQRH